MGRDATKAAGNPWYEARLRAAKNDPRLQSREGAAELLNMSVSSVSDTETGVTKVMPAEKAMQMAELYDDPNLLNYYCLHECPIGCKRPISDEVFDMELATIRLIKKLRSETIATLVNQLVDIEEDGRVDAEEKMQLIKILDQLDEIARAVAELKTAGQIELRK